MTRIIPNRVFVFGWLFAFFLTALIAVPIVAAGPTEPPPIEQGTIITVHGNGVSGTVEADSGVVYSYYAPELRDQLQVGDRVSFEITSSGARNLQLIEPAITPSEATAALIDDVEALNLDKGVANSLISTLESAVAALDRDNTKAAVNKLNAFKKKVAAQRGKKIRKADADALSAAAQSIIDSVD